MLYSMPTTVITSAFVKIIKRNVTIKKDWNKTDPKLKKLTLLKFLWMGGVERLREKGSME